MRAIVFAWFLVGPVIQSVLVFLLVRRRLYRRGMYPFFLGYTLYSIVVTIIRLTLVHRPVQYPIFYWSAEVMYGLLAILSLNEVFGRIFRLDYEDYPWLRYIFPSMVVGISTGLIIWWRFFYRTPSGNHFGLLASAFVGFNEGVHTIESILLALFVVLRFLLSPGWNRYDYGVVVGFGLSGLITMTADMVRFNVGPGYQMWYENAPGIAYIIVTTIWLHAFWPKHDPKPKPVMQFREMLERTDRSNEAIKTIHDWLRRRR